MIILTTNKGKEIECDLVIRGSQHDVLHIYTHTITPVKAYQIFGDPEECEKLTTREEKTVKVEEEVEENGETVKKKKDAIAVDERVYTGFTEVYSVQKPPIRATDDKDQILIWLQKPRTEEEG